MSTLSIGTPDIMNKRVYQEYLEIKEQGEIVRIKLKQQND
jgi:hypothetical protein